MRFICAEGAEMAGEGALAYDLCAIERILDEACVAKKKSASSTFAQQQQNGEEEAEEGAQEEEACGAR